MKWLVLLLFLLAGCSDAPASEDVEDDPSQPAPPEPEAANEQLAWNLTNCQFMYSNALADASAVQASLPEGFTVQTNAQGRVGVGFETNICEGGSGLDGTVSPQTYATVWVGVNPPDVFQAQAGAFHVMNFEVLVQDQARRDWMQQRGIPAVDGSISLSETLTSQIITLELGDNNFRFTVLPGAPGGEAGGTFDQWTPGGQDLTYWQTDWSVREQMAAAGTIEVAPGSIYADWFESPVVPAQFNVGTWDYTDGVIIHPAPLAG